MTIFLSDGKGRSKPCLWPITDTGVSSLGTNVKINIFGNFSVKSANKKKLFPAFL